MGVDFDLLGTAGGQPIHNALKFFRIVFNQRRDLVLRQMIAVVEIIWVADGPKILLQSGDLFWRVGQVHYQRQLLRRWSRMLLQPFRR